MIAMEQIIETLNNNGNIDTPLKENLKELIVIFNEQFPNVSLDNLNDRLGNLKILKSSKYATKKVSKYNLGINTLEFNVDKIEQGYDMKYIMMYELLNIITSKENMTGFSFDNTFTALNAGYTAILANNLVGNESEVPFLEDEIVSTNLVALAVGNDKMMQAYFNNNPSILVNSMQNAEEIIRKMDYRYENANPETTKHLHIDEAITKSVSSNVNVEQFELWASMSKEKSQIIPMINNYKMQIEESSVKNRIA